MGPLDDLTVIELGGIGPVPFGGMMLADLGARVIRIDRTDEVGPGTTLQAEPLRRTKQSLALDLKHPEAADLVLRLCERADALIEGFRPGVVERLGIGPDECMRANPALVYGRMTGWGQTGPLAAAAGHDINYIALAGVLDMIGKRGAGPTIPLNLVADFGGGGMLLAVGVLAGVLNAQRTGAGQVVDAAMVEGAALLSTMIHGFRAQGLWAGDRGENFLDGSAPFYAVYETSDGGWVSIGAIEPDFYAELAARLDIDDLPSQYDRTTWDAAHERLAAVFARESLDHWRNLLEGTDACFAPVLTADQAAGHPHNEARRVFVEVDGVRQPAPAPRFERTQLPDPTPPRPAGGDTDAVLAEIGLDAAAIGRLRAAKVVA